MWIWTRNLGENHSTSKLGECHRRSAREVASAPQGKGTPERRRGEGDRFARRLPRAGSATSPPAPASGRANVRAGAAVSWRLAARGGRGFSSVVQSAPGIWTRRTSQLRGALALSESLSGGGGARYSGPGTVANESGTWSSARRRRLCHRKKPRGPNHDRRTPIVLHQVLWWWTFQALVGVHLPCRRLTSRHVTARRRGHVAAARGNSQAWTLSEVRRPRRGRRWVTAAEHPAAHSATLVELGAHANICIGHRTPQRDLDKGGQNWFSCIFLIGRTDVRREADFLSLRRVCDGRWRVEGPAWRERARVESLVTEVMSGRWLSECRCTTLFENKDSACDSSEARLQGSASVSNYDNDRFSIRLANNSTQCRRCYFSLAPLPRARASVSLS